MKASTTLIEFTTRAQRNFPGATGKFTALIEGLALATKIISREINAAGLGQMMGLAGKRNVQGEDVAKLDEYSNDTLIRTLTRCGSACALASEELAVPIRLPGDPDPGEYAVVFDPLDGSSNIDYAISVGTIFGIYRRVSPPEGLGTMEDLLQPPAQLVASGYTVYGSSTIFVLTTGIGVYGFTLDPTIGEFVLSHPDIKVPPKGKTYSCNAGNRPIWTPGVQRAVDAFAVGEGGKPGRSMRYVGSLVADAHRTLLQGGIFMYPADKKSPTGKLRLLYEAGPLAFLFEQAGGAATDGEKRILELEPRTLHDRTPLIIGSRDDVERYMKVSHDPS